MDGNNAVVAGPAPDTGELAGKIDELDRQRNECEAARRQAAARRAEFSRTANRQADFDAANADVERLDAQIESIREQVRVLRERQRTEELANASTTIKCLRARVATLKKQLAANGPAAQGLAERLVKTSQALLSDSVEHQKTLNEIARLGGHVAAGEMALAPARAAGVLQGASATAKALDAIVGGAK